MFQILKMAYRDLGRNRRRSFFSALALGIGLSLLLLMASVVKGEMQGSLETGLKLESGHLQVRASSYDENRTSLAWKDLVADPEALAAQIASLQPVKVATPRLYASGIVANGDVSLGARIIGIDTTSPANAPFQNGIVAGSFLQADDRDGVLVGRPLADKLELNVDDQVSMLVNTSNGTVDEQSFTIRGIYDTHTPSFDRSTVFMPLAKAQAITQTENHASTIFILLNDREQADAVAAAIQAPQYQVKTWLQMNELIVTYEQFADSYMAVLYLIVLGIVATVIVNTLVMAVFERTREIGILSAIGMKSGRIMAMFLAESSLLAVGGILIGLALGGIFVAYATYHGFYLGDFGVNGMALGETIYAQLTWNDAVSLTLIAFVVTLLAGLYPAILAARMEPVAALHGGQ